MALHTYELNDLTGVTCKECLAKKSVVVSNVNASSSALSPKNCLLLNDSCSSHYNSTGKLLADPNRLKPNKGDRLKPKQETLEGELEQPQLINSGAVFMFEKKLTPSDCDPKIGRVVMPKFHAQRLYPLPSHQRKKAVAYIDTEGTVWKFIVRWWPNRKSRKYVLDGARQCCLAMQWKAGDTLKFYKKLSDGKMIMHLQKKVCESTSSVIPSVPSVANSDMLQEKPPLLFTYARRKKKALHQNNQLSNISKKGVNVSKKNKKNRKGIKEAS